MTHSSSWKRRERDAARLFGATRQPCSGSNGGDTSSDSTHPKVYIETKLRASTAVRNLWEDTKKKAKKEKKLPLLVLFDKGKKGGLVVMHQDDMMEIFAAYQDGGMPELE